MASEQTPLLQDTILATEEAEQELQHEAIYRRFTPARKRLLLAHVSFAGLMPLFISGSFIPSIPQVARDLDTTGAVVSLAISVTIFSCSVGSLTWASYSGYYGRRPVYVISSVVQCIGSIGVALAQTVPQLMIFRILQALGSSSGFSIGMAVIGDIYKIEERGTAAGVYFAGILLGPAIAPVIGGFTAEFYSWRVMQAGLFVAAFAFFVVTYLFFPETTHPGKRGVEKAGNSSGFVWLNPLKALTLLRSPVILCVLTAGATTLLADFFLVLPVAYTLGKKYHITSEAAIGALLIPDGLGSMFGAPIAGYISDRIIINRRRRGETWIPEDRLRGIQFSALVLIPVSVLIAGFTTTYVDGPLGLVINLACLFINGFGVDGVLGSLGAYNVDILRDRSAEVTAAAMAYRGSIVSLAISGLIPSIETIGLAATYTITAIISWFGFMLIWCVIRYGERMRAYVDIGFSTARDN